MKNTVFNLIISFLIIIAAFFSVFSECTDYEYTDSLAEIVGENSDPANDIQEITSLQSPQDVLNAVESAENTGSDGSDIEFSNFNIVTSYKYAKSINNDTIGWLNIPNMGSYPVMYTNNNSFYLTHSATGAQHENGAIFMNAYNNGDFSDICLIHGHHLRSGGMFGSLKKYKDNWFFNHNDLIELYDGEKLKYYRPFSVFFYKDGEEFIPEFFNDDETKIKYIQSLLDRSMTSFEKEYTIRATSDIMILSTCDYEFEDCRLAVACYEVLSIPYTE